MQCRNETSGFTVRNIMKVSHLDKITLFGFRAKKWQVYEQVARRRSGNAKQVSLCKKEERLENCVIFGVCMSSKFMMDKLILIHYFY